MNDLIKKTISASFIASLLLMASPASAATPFLTVENIGNGNMRLSVTNADAFAQITLFRRQSSQLWTVITNYGQTDAFGYFTSLSAIGSDSTNNLIEQYVVVNGWQSNIATLNPFGFSSCGTFGCSNLILSQTSTTLTVGQSLKIFVSNVSGSLFVSQNTNPNAVSAAIGSNNEFKLFALNAGSSTVTVCASNGCGSVFVTTVIAGANVTIWLGQNNVTLNTGQSQNISIFTNHNLVGSFHISNNSNANAVSANISGSNLNLTGQNAGTSTVRVCQFNTNACAEVFVTVTGSALGSIWLSQNSVSLNVGQTVSVNIFNTGNSGGYYVSSNSNFNAVQTSISGNSLNLTGQLAGNATVRVCQFNSSSCADLAVTVFGTSTNNQIWLNQSSLTLNVGQSQSVGINSNFSTSFYLSQNSNPNVASANITGSTLNVIGQNAGNTNITVCQSTTNTCANLWITVQSGSVLGTNTYNNGTLILEGQTVYITYKNLKSGFASREVFEGLGYKFSNVINVGFSGLTNSGFVIRTTQAAHPWGSWVKSGNTVYFVHEFGLIPIANWDTFLNNGGQAQLVVPANSHDFQLPFLSVMQMNDPRLR